MERDPLKKIEKLGNIEKSDIFLSKRRKHCLIILLALTCVLNTFTSFADPTDILKKLDKKEWNFIELEKYVKYGGKNWSGANDVSFKYKIVENQDIVYIIVDVKDDKVILKDSETILSDHVEIWLADPNMVSDRLTQIEKLRNGEKDNHYFGINNFKRRLKENYESSKEEIKVALVDLHAIEKKYKDRNYYIQLIFNTASVFSIPKNTNIQNIHYAYKTTSDGYEFLARIPLNGLFDFKTNTINSLNFLIDVVDIDDTTTNKQKTLLSTSSKRIFSKPETFNTLQFKKSFSLPISVIEEIKTKLEPNGYFRIDNGKYVYVTQEEYYYEGSYGADRYAFPDVYVPLELKDISRHEELQVFSFDSKLAFKEKDKDKYTIFDLKGNKDYSDLYVLASGDFYYENLFQVRKNDHYYLLLDVQGASRWPPGETRCGSGYESNIIWMDIDEKTSVKSIQSVLYSSCELSRWREDYFLTDNSLKLVFWDNNRKKTTTYDNRTPEMGLIPKPKYYGFRDPDPCKQLQEEILEDAEVQPVVAVQVPPNTEFPPDDLEKKVKQEEMKLSWNKRLEEMQGEFNKVNIYEKNKDIKADLKYELWQKFAHSFGQDNPFSEEDEKLLRQAVERMKSWFLVGEEEKMVLIKGGCFNMGDTSGNGTVYEKPVHEVCVRDFYLRKYEVTQGDWKKIMGSNFNPSRFTNCGDNCPVEQVSWEDVDCYIKELNNKTGKKYRLPTEAEWEYAARGGEKKEDRTGELDKFAWFGNNSSWKTHPVGQKNPNGLGLYDMNGNVDEWVSDWFAEDYYKNSPRNNPQGPNSGSSKVLRGRSWGHVPENHTFYSRSFSWPAMRSSFNGFRLAQDKD